MIWRQTSSKEKVILSYFCTFGEKGLKYERIYNPLPLRRKAVCYRGYIHMCVYTHIHTHIYIYVPNDSGFECRFTVNSIELLVWAHSSTSRQKSQDEALSKTCYMHSVCVPLEKHQRQDSGPSWEALSRQRTYQAALREGLFRKPCRRSWALIPLPECHGVLTDQKFPRRLRWRRRFNDRKVEKGKGKRKREKEAKPACIW